MRYNYAKNVLEVFGYFWQRVWKDENLITGLAAAIGTMQQQTDITYNEFEEYMSRLTLPVTSHLRWKKITLYENQMKLRPYGILDGLQTGRSVLIGSPVPPIQYVFPWQLVLQTPFITNSPSLEAGTILNVESDFVLNDDELIFFSNPFDVLPGGASVNDKGDPVKTVECWGYCSEEDTMNVKNFFGTYVGMNISSTDLFKKLTNAIWDLYNEGATVRNINNFMGVLTSCDYVDTDGIVEDIFTEVGRIWVKTENGLYSAPDTFNAIVNVNDKIYKGQNIFDTFKIYEGRETVPDSVVSTFVVGSGYLGGGYTAGLSFDNKEVDLTFEYVVTKVPGIPEEDQPEILTSEDGSVLVIDKEGVEYILTDQVSYEASGLSVQGVVPVPVFEIGGFPDDVDKLRAVMAQNIADTGVDIITELTDNQAFPYTINPFKYIQEAALRNNIIFIEMNADALASTKAIIASLRYLANTIPAGTTFMLYLNSTFAEEVYDLTSEVEETVTGYIVSELTEEYSNSNIVDTLHINKKVG